MRIGTFSLFLCGLCVAVIVYASCSRGHGSKTSVPTVTKVQMVGSVPTLLLNGQPYTINAWTAGLEMDLQNNAQVKAAMDAAKADGFNAVEIEANWRLIERGKR